LLALGDFGQRNQVLTVQTTLFVVWIFPPPTASAFMLKWANRSGAGLAAHGNKALIV